MTYTESRNKVIDLQKQIAEINHKMENPKIKSIDLMELADHKNEVFQKWNSALIEMHKFPEYQGIFKKNN